MAELTDKRVLITGAGRGLGRELAFAFARAGAEVVVTDREPDRVARTAQDVRAEGFAAVGYAMDVCDPEQIEAVRERLHVEQGPIDVLVNNAGIVHGGAFTEVPLHRHLTTFRVNVLGPVAVTHAFLPEIVRRPHGYIVNIASASGLIALPFAATYASSKWATLGFSESLREELRLGGHGHVRVMTVCPSYIGTGLFHGVRTPKLTRMLDSREVASLVLQAIRKNKERVLTPWLVKLIPLARGTLPASWFRRLCDSLGVSTSMRHWRGYGAADEAGQDRLSRDPPPAVVGTRTP